MQAHPLCKKTREWYTDTMKKRIVTVIILAVAAALIFWFFYALRSYAVMGVYSAQHKRESVMRTSGFDIDIPSGKGWYPFVMTYNADGFARWSGTDADMSIMYNFGAFDARTRTSSIYDMHSDHYSSFYGAYVARQDEGAFGFNEDGSADMDAVALAVKYDYTQLVIADFGCDEIVFLVDEHTVQQDVDYAESVGWTRVDAVMTANGAAHDYAGYKQPYLQYGRPMEDVDIDFETVTLYGRVYMKYFEEYGCSVMLYVIAPSRDAVDVCDKEILAHARISDLQQ